MRRINVKIIKETQKALLINSNGRQGWIQRRWLGADCTVTKVTFEKAVANYEQRQADYKEAKEWTNSLHRIIAIARETEKALAIEVNFDAYNLERNFKKLLWVPKSIVKEKCIPGWFILKKIRQLADELTEQIHTGVFCDFIAIENCDRLF